MTSRNLVDFELPSSANDGPTSVAEIRRLLRDICERQLGANRTAIVPLSGGLDSRLVLSTLLDLLPARDVQCFTYGFKGHLDYEIAPLVARRAGVAHVMRGFDEITFDPDEFEAQVTGLDLDCTPTLNLVAHYYTKKLTALCLAELPSEAALWSGFLGDRAWAGKWLEAPDRDLRAAAIDYASTYANPHRARIVNGKYDPVERLLELYRDVRAPPRGSSWCELIDLQQRQYYVKRSFVDGDRQYVFPLAAPEVVARLLSLPTQQRAQYRFYRRYALAFHGGLFGYPTTTRLGAPLRAGRTREKLDRNLRLARRCIERLLGVSLGGYATRRYDTALVESTWPEHRVAVSRGLARTLLRIADFGYVNAVDSNALMADRATSQILASLGYLL